MKLKAANNEQEDILNKLRDYLRKSMNYSKLNLEELVDEEAKEEANQNQVDEL